MRPQSKISNIIILKQIAAEYGYILISFYIVQTSNKFVIEILPTSNFKMVKADKRAVIYNDKPRLKK